MNFMTTFFTSFSNKKEFTVISMPSSMIFDVVGWDFIAMSIER